MSDATPPVAPIVIKVGGALLDDPAARSDFLDRFAEAARIGTPLALVHGGGAAVDRHLDRIGVETERRDGIRLTPPTLMPEIAAVLSGQVGTSLLADLRRRHVAATAVRLADDEGIVVERLECGFDPGSVGTVTGGSSMLFDDLIATGRIPVIASIGMLSDGTPLNVNADDAASGIARVLGARALLLLTDVPGVLDEHGNVIRRLDFAAADRLIDEGVIAGGMIPKVRGAIDAAAQSGCPVVIGDWADPRVLADPLADTTVATVVPPPSPPSIVETVSTASQSPLQKTP
ncbi:MAG: acetylglutamate kinase [Planctomycetota bacterium]|jgi:acetylglutamate kinase